MMYARSAAFSNFGCFGTGMMGGWGMIATIVIILVVVALGVHIVRKNKQKNPNSPALDMLKMKFVQGEITEEEYLKRKDVLSK